MKAHKHAQSPMMGPDGGQGLSPVPGSSFRVFMSIFASVVSTRSRRVPQLERPVCTKSVWKYPLSGTATTTIKIRLRAHLHQWPTLNDHHPDRAGAGACAPDHAANSHDPGKPAAHVNALTATCLTTRSMTLVQHISHRVRHASISQRSLTQPTPLIGARRSLHFTFAEFFRVIIQVSISSPE